VLTGARAAALAAGTDYALVVFSIDPRESPALANEKKAAYIAQYAPGGVQRDWHFLTATQPAIDAITRASGFRYFYDDKIGEYAHPAGALIVTPHGVISRYLFGVAFDPGELRLALAAAAGDRVGSLAERLWLLCYHYDPVTGKYGFAALAAVRAAALGSVLALGALFLALRGRERKPRGSRRNRE
jgi:protein SCO1/2